MTYPIRSYILAVVMKMKLQSIRHDWPEKEGFMISRPNGHKAYTFLHFTTPVQIQVQGHTVTARPGACIFYSPGHPQWFTSKEKLIHNWMHVTGDFSSLLAELDIRENEILYPANPAFISEIFRNIEQEFYSDHPRKEALLDCYIREFLIRFSRALTSDVSEPAATRADRLKFAKVRHEILSQPEKKWTVQQMAALASLSPSRFHMLYKTVFGTSPLQDLIAARISCAKSMLLSNDTLPLQEIAERAGYNDQFHFIRQFKAATGKTPGQYRKSHK